MTGRYILGRHLIGELVKQGVVSEDTRRVTIDCALDDVVTVYVEKVGDKRLLSIVPPLGENGVQITTLEANDLDPH